MPRRRGQPRATTGSSTTSPFPQPPVLLVPVTLRVPHSPWSAVFLLHAAVEAPFVVLTFFFYPFMQMTDTAVVFLKLYTSIVAATCIASVLVFPHQEYYPGKRALAIALCTYHSIASLILFRAPQFIPHPFGTWLDPLGMTPENIWAMFHGALGIMMAIWWESTLQDANMFWGAGPDVA